jgi:hypothetical protein
MLRLQRVRKIPREDARHLSLHASLAPCSLSHAGLAFPFGFHDFILFILSTSSLPEVDSNLDKFGTMRFPTETVRFTNLRLVSLPPAASPLNKTSKHILQFARILALDIIIIIIFQAQGDWQVEQVASA